MRPLLLLTLCGAVAASLWSLWVPADGAAEADDEARALLAPRTLIQSSASAKPSAQGAGPGGRPLAMATATAPWPLPTAQVLAAWAAEPAPAVKPTDAAAQTVALRATSPDRKASAAAGASAAQGSAGVPAFPYRWIGRFEDHDGVQIFLAGTQGTLSVRSGDTIDGRWRLDRVLERQLQLIWLPTGESVQVLAT